MIPNDTFLHELADLADSVSMPRFVAQDFVVESKPDKTEVTIADRNTELAVTEHILTTFPSHQVLGEEFGVKGDPNGTWRWIIDPIDGTANFTRGVPVWATLIAAEEAGTLRAAMVSCPALHRRWWAIKGAGAFLNGKRLQVSGIRSLADATISFSDGYWQHTANAHLRQALDHVLAHCARQKGFGDFWQHMLVAEGALDIALEPVVSLWDLAAVQLIVEEAGGTFSNLQGERRADGGSALSTNGVLHEQVLSALHAATTNHTSPLQT